MSKKMSATMAVALADILDRGGEIVRHQGGYWTVPGAVKTAVIGRPFEWWLGTSTVEGLVRRGELFYTEHREGRNGNFPVRAVCKALAFLHEENSGASK